MADSGELFEKSLEFWYPAASVVLCLFGTLANLASLVYFIKKEEKSIGDKMLMLLNSTDLLLCICATIITLLFSAQVLQEDYENFIYLFLIAGFSLVYILLIDGTAYATCLLSVTRGISIAFPFYKIKGKSLVIVGIIVFIIIELIGPVSSVASFFAYSGSSVILRCIMVSRMVTSLLIILVVVSATVVAVYKLTRKGILGSAESVDRGNIKATWTVVILSTLFFVFNSILLGFTMTGVVYAYDDELGLESFPFTSTFFGVFFAIPLNSTLNPIVYLTRRSDMRQFFKQSFPKLSRVMQWRGVRTK